MRAACTHLEMPMPFLSSVLVILTVALTSDLQSRRIPNALTVPALIVGCLAQAANGGWSGLGLALLGIAVGAALTIVPFFVGALGAGDVKLMAALGAFFGPLAILVVSLAASLVAGVAAVVVAARAGQLRGAIADSRHALSGTVAPSVGSLPYAVPVAIAVVVALPILLRLPS